MRRWKEGGKAAFRLEYLLASLTAFLVLAIPLAGAIQPPDVTFIPDKISVKSSFLMVADPQAPPTIISRINWVIYGIPTAYGEFTRPVTGNDWLYYSADPNLFPSPTYGTPYVMEVTTIPLADVPQNTTINISVGGIEVRSNVQIEGKNVSVSAWSFGQVVSSISYKVHDSDTFAVIKSGQMTYNTQTGIFTTNMVLESGEYYIEFTTSTATDFGGGVLKVTVGGTGPGQTGNVKYDSIIYSPVINPGQKFRIETFKITNTGTDNLTNLGISVAPEIATYLAITPKKTSMEPNESVYLTVELQNVHTSMNISTFANLKSGSTQLAQIPVNLMVSVIGSQNYSSCVGKADKDLCLGGICCTEVCRTGGADCCSSSDCSLGEECSSSFKCAPAVIPGECEGKSDNTTCSAGVCCSGECVECCSDSDCSAGEICTSNSCEAETQNECAGKNDKASCTGGICCSEFCIKDGACCVDGDCPAGQSCSFGNVCEAGSGGIDFITIGLIAGGVAVAGIAGFFLLKKFRKKGKEGDEELEPGEEGEEEFSDEDFY
jgi:hypothetical protein